MWPCVKSILRRTQEIGKGTVILLLPIIGSDRPNKNPHDLFRPWGFSFEITGVVILYRQQMPSADARD